MNTNSNYETTCDPLTGICTAKLRVSRRSAYDIPESRQGAWVRERVKNSNGYLGYGLNVTKRDIDLAARTVTFVASTEQIDRYGDVILQNGWDTKNFSANPIILFAHDSRSLPIGKAAQLGIDSNGNLTVRIEFSKAVGSYDLPEIVLQLISQGMLNCVSVGFIPTEFEYRFEKDDDGNQLPFPSGRIYKQQELLEISVVPVPANPGALVVSNAYQKAFSAIEDVSGEAIVTENVERSYFTYDAVDGMVYSHGSRNPSESEANADVHAHPALLVKMYKDGQSRPFVIKEKNMQPAFDEAVRAMERDSFSSQGFLCKLAGFDDNEFPVYRSVIHLSREEVSDSKNPHKESQENKMPENCRCSGAADTELKSVVPFKHYPLAPSSATWDAGKEMGSTDKPADWKSMCTIVLNDGKNKGDYKLPHHKGPEGKFATVKRGVAAGLGRLNQVKGASAADKKGARTHLVKHMAEFQKADGKAFDEELFSSELEALETMRDAFPEGSEEQEAVIRAIEVFVIELDGEQARRAVVIASFFTVAEDKAGAAAIMVKRFPVIEERKFSNETMNKKMQRAHKSLSAGKDELHSVHDDAMDMLGQCCDMVECLYKPAADGSKAADHLGEETVATNLGKALDMAYEAKQMVRRAASRYADHMQDAVERLDALCEYVGKKEKPDGGDGGSKPAPAEVVPAATEDEESVKNFLEEASKTSDAASNGSVDGNGSPQKSAPTAGSAKAEEEDVSAFLLRATTADDHAAH